MNNWIIVILLAILQGVAEFLPISSSGHLALLGKIFNMENQENAALSIVLHTGSLVAIAAYYLKTLIGFFKKDQLHLLGMVIIGSIPAGIVGILLKKTDLLDMLFGDMISVAMGFLITASILRLTSKEKLRADSNTELKEITVKQSIITGLAQAFAIVPGISRSGSTIAAGFLSGMKFEAAAAFSFLLALPAIAGASLLEIIELSRNDFQLGDFSPWQLLTGFAVSAVASLLSLILLVKIIRNRKLSYFAWYLFFMGAAVIIWQMLLLNRG